MDRSPLSPENLKAENLLLRNVRDKVMYTFGRILFLIASYPRWSTNSSLNAASVQRAVNILANANYLQLIFGIPVYTSKFLVLRKVVINWCYGETWGTTRMIAYTEWLLVMVVVLL